MEWQPIKVGADFKKWRKRNNLIVEDVATLFGMGKDSIYTINTKGKEFTKYQQTIMRLIDEQRELQDKYIAVMQMVVDNNIAEKTALA
jgi:hypothetical protein